VGAEVKERNWKKNQFRNWDKRCKMKKEEKRTLREDVRIIARAVHIWMEICPRTLVYLLLSTVAWMAYPYFPLYMSARLINGITEGRGWEELVTLAAVTVFGVFALSIIIRLIDNRRDVWSNMLFQHHMLYLSDKQNRMQYEHMENSDVTLKQQEIFAHMNATGSGLLKVIWILPGLVGNISNLIFSAALTISMFRTVPQAETEGILGFVNSAGCMFVFVAYLALNAFISVKVTGTRTVREMAAWSKLAADNTLLTAYLYVWGDDVHISDLKSIVVDEFKKVSHPAYIKEAEQVNIRFNTIAKLQDTALTALVFLITAAKAFLGVFGVGSFVLYQGTVSRFAGAVSSLAQNIAALRENNQYLLKLYEYLDLPNTMYQGSLAVEKRDDIDYEIEFRDVSFRYPGTENWVLRHVNMKFRIGDKLAIVGENGSGKTTFIKLLCRLYDPTEGMILLNGIDITRYRYEEYLKLFSVVFQDYRLFELSLAANVSADFHYDRRKVEESLEQAGFGEKLRSLEKGVETIVGRSYDDSGLELSGGEGQKVAMARALYKDAPFMVLDEPTAALDPIAEAAVYERIHSMVANKTAVFISHRLSSCRFCDDIIVFDKGQIVQRGNHDALVDQEGKYRALWNAQAQYYT